MATRPWGQKIASFYPLNRRSTYCVWFLVCNIFRSTTQRGGAWPKWPNGKYACAGGRRRGGVCAWVKILCYASILFYRVQYHNLYLPRARNSRAPDPVGPSWIRHWDWHHESCDRDSPSLPWSGAGTNLKVGEGRRSGAKCQKNFFGRVPPLFGSKSTISCFGERFRDGQYSLVSFLFAVLLLTVPPVPSHL